MTDSVSFPAAVSAVSPLDGQAIDGSARPRRRYNNRPRREHLDRSLTFFCSNKNCDHMTWAPAEQARHMAAEFWWAMQALVRLAPDSPEARKITGGILLSELTNDECRAANAECARAYKAGGIPSAEAALGKLEYSRRRHAGILAPVKRESLIPPVGSRAKLRQARGLSQRQLAVMLGIGQTTVQYWESGARIPATAERARSYAEALGWKP